MPTSGREPADLYFLTPRFAPPFLSILPYPAGQKYSGLLGAQKRGTPKPFGQSVPLFIWSELIQNVVMLMVPVTRSMAHSRFFSSLSTRSLFSIWSSFSSAAYTSSADGIVEPVVLSDRTGRCPVQGKTLAVHKPLHVRGIARNRLQQLPGVSGRDSHHFKGVLHQSAPRFHQLPVVAFQLFLQ